MNRKLVWLAGVLVGSILGLLSFALNDAYAEPGRWNFDKKAENCKNAAPSYSHIESVYKACDDAAKDGWPKDSDGTAYNYCSLWLGERAGDIKIYVNSNTGTTTVNYYGMCIYYNIKKSNGISRAEVRGVNGSIGSIQSLTRGTWNNPTYASAQLDVAKFISGVSGEDCGEYTCYKRRATIYRCNAVNTTSCGEQQQDIIVAVKKQTVTLTARFRLANSDTIIPTYSDIIKSGSKNSSQNFDSITRHNGKSNDYVFKCWSTSTSTKNCVSNGASYTTTRSDNKVIYGLYEIVDLFKGRTNVASTNMALTDQDASRRVAINCSVDGCTATFTHKLKRERGSGTTDWNISRLSNYSDGNYGATTSASTNKGTFSSDSETIVGGTDRTYKLKPGVVICEQLEFKARGNSQTTTKTQACVSAKGSAGLSLDINVSSGGAFQKTVYAKPGDVVTYKVTYNPALQYTYNLIPEGVKVNGGTVDSNGTNQRLGSVFTRIKSSAMGNWKNGFNIWGSGELSFNKNETYSSGDSTIQEPTNNGGILNNGVITNSHVGKVLEEVAKTNANDSVKTTPKQVSFDEENGENVANVITDEVLSDVARVIVPYNFKISTRIVDGSNVVFAGEDGYIRYEIQVNKKNNRLTGGEYATSVTGVKHRVEVCYDDDGRLQCKDSEWKNITDSDINSKPAGEPMQFGFPIDVPDITAGTRKIRVRSFVTPGSSGDDNNIDPAKFTGEVASDEVWIAVAKKPSFQVWGGNLFVNGNVTVPASNKKTLSGYSSGATFGSWSELGVFGNGQIRGIFSGASAGYSGANFLKNPGGLGKTELCLRSVLSFANNNCGSGITGNMAASGLTTDKNKLSEYIDTIAPGMDEKISGGNIALNSGYSTTENGVLYWRSDSDLTIGSSILTSGKTYVVRSRTNVMINGNLEYENSSYTNLNEIPKLFIYAEGNIKIACGVNRIDAVLITKGDVNTCSDSSDINNEANSNRLRINGAIIANTAHLNRTYGAGVGNRSMIPAEIINYDTTLYMWLFGDTSMGGDGSGDVGTFTEVNRRELAPRY